MRVSQLRRLIQLVEESKISELEISRWGTRVRISKNSHHGGNVASRTVEALASDHAFLAERPPTAESKRLVPVIAPMVGTFYRAPAPDAPPYVDVGDHVRPGQVVCIIEAMKLMNEIESEISGRVAQVLVKNEEPVEYGQELFLIDPD